MTPMAQTLSSLWRRPGRTTLTALGTALGIATIVALLAVADGAKRSAGELPSPRRLGPRAVPEGRRRPDHLGPVDQPHPAAAPHPGHRRRHARCVLLVEDVKRDPGAIVFGAQPSGFLTKRLVFSRGRMFSSPNQIVVGDQLAKQLHLALRRLADGRTPHAARGRHLPHRRGVPGRRRVRPTGHRPGDQRDAGRGDHDPDQARRRHPPGPSPARATPALPGHLGHRRPRRGRPGRRQRPARSPRRRWSSRCWRF